jgi:ABC-type multidrug transport system fused ATPase/permease subunit
MFRTLNPFQGYFHYLGIFRRYIGNKIFFLFAMSLVAVAAESCGLMMLLPLLKVSELAEGNLGGKADTFLKILDFIGLPQTKIGVVAFIVLTFTLKGAVKFVEGAYRERLMSRMTRLLKSSLLHHYTKMEYIFYASRNTGHFLNVINDQVNRFLRSFTNMTQFSAQIITTSGYLLFAFFLSWPFTLMAMACGFVILILFRVLSELSKRFSCRISRENTVLQKLLVQMIQSLKYLSSTASTKTLEDNAQASIAIMTRLQFKVGLAGAFTKAVSEPIAVLFLSVLLLFQIVILQQPLAPVFIALILFYRAMFTVINVQGSWQKVMDTIGGFEMIREEFSVVEKHLEVSGSAQIKGLRQGIKFDHVSFAYEQEPILLDINLFIPMNSTVAIVGESGAGKSTMVDLITLLLKPKKGQVIIDGIPHDQLDYQDWRRNIGFVTQETVVFDDSIANNISLWACDFEKDETCKYRMEEAARRAYCYPFIDALPDGYKTIVGDRGVKLSGGQQQRLFMARELFKHPRLLILDEATSSLDTESERYIQKSIDELKGKMTVVIIAHRLSTIKNADYIYVLDRGKIVEEGTYEELVCRKNSRFGKMVSMQRL